MSMSLNETVSASTRSRPWTPIITQQLRLRHLYRIIAYNLENSDDEFGGFHYTLHSTAMSAPFYTSEVLSSCNPKWAELNLSDLQILSCTGFVIRVWKSQDIILKWGIHMSGLVYLGNNASEIRSEAFIANTVIFVMRGGFFTSLKYLRKDLQRPLPCVDSLNLISTEKETKVFKLAAIKMPLAEIRTSYNLTKLLKLQSLQISIRNKNLSIYAIKEAINAKLNPIVPKQAEADQWASSNHNVRYAPQLLTMSHLNKLLQGQPAKVHPGEIQRVQRDIEDTKLRNKILQQERDRKCTELRLLKDKFNNLLDFNEEQNSQLMEDYRHLSKEIERLREWKKEYIHQREILHQLTKKLQCRRRQLMSELLQIYPIHNANGRYYINNVELPRSDLLFDCSDIGLSVALGYCGHVLIMCASFLQIPLRYPIRHLGSRSVMEDHVTQYHDKCKEFPLYTRGKDRMLFTKAVYLLNKNIAQYLYALGFKTPDLRATLPNLLMLLQGKENKTISHDTETSNGSPKEEVLKKVMERRVSQDNMSARPFSLCGSHGSDPILDCIRHEAQIQCSLSPRRRAPRVKSQNNPGLSQILAIPEAVLNKQLSGSTLLTYMRNDFAQLDQPSTSSECSVKKGTNCDIVKQPSIEEGTEMIPNSSTPHAAKSNTEALLIKNEKRLSRSVGSFDEEKFARISLESTSSDPFINISTETNNSSRSVDDLLNASASKTSTQQYEIQKWIDNGPNMLVQSEENLYPDEYLGRSVETPNDGHLTLRTDALVQRKSFNLVKPRF